MLDPKNIKEITTASLFPLREMSGTELQGKIVAYAKTIKDAGVLAAVLPNIEKIENGIRVWKVETHQGLIFYMLPPQWIYPKEVEVTVSP